MFTFSPVMYLEWLMNLGWREQMAVAKVEKAYWLQTGRKIRMIQRPHKGAWVWDYTDARNK